jgi:TP901 family phage tail tape measure protein
MEQLGAVALAVGNDQNSLGASARGAAEAMTMLYKGGLTTNEILGDMQGYLSGTTELTGALRAAFDLAAATELDVAQAADVAVVALSTFGRELETEAERADFAVGALDFLVRTANASVSEVEDLTGALSYVGPAAQVAGWSLQDVGVAMGLMSNAGMRGTTIGTSLNGMFVDLTETTKKSQVALDEMRISLFDEGEMRPLVDIVGQFDVALEGLTDQERIDRLGAIFDIRGARAMSVLLEQGVDGWNDMATAIDGAQTMSEQAAIRMDTLIGKQEILGSTIETLKIQIHEGMKEPLKDATDLLNEVLLAVGPPLVDLFGRIGNKLSDMITDDVIENVRSIGTFLRLMQYGLEEGYDPIKLVGQALGIAFGVETQQKFDAIVSKVQEVIGIFQDLGAGIGEAFSQIAAGDVGAGLQGLSEAIWSALPEGLQERIGEFIDGIVEKFNLKPVVDAVRQSIQAAISTIGEFAPSADIIAPLFNVFDDLKGSLSQLGEALQPVMPLLKQAAQIIGVVLVGAIVTVIGIITSLISAVLTARESFLGAIQGILAGATQAISGIINVFTGLYDTIGGLVEGIVTGDFTRLKDGWARLKTGVVQIVTGLVQSIVSAFTGFLATIITMVGTFISAIINFFSTLYQQLVGGSIVPDMINAIIQWFVKLPLQVLAILAQFVTDAIVWFVNLNAELVILITKLVTEGVQKFVEFASDVLSAIGDWVTEMVGKFSDLATDVAAKVAEFVQNVLDKFSDMREDIKSYIGGIVEDVKGFVSDFSSAGSDLIGGLWGGIKSKFDSVVGRVSDLASQLPTAVKRVLGISSPSKVMMEIGGSLNEGLAVGIQRSMAVPLRAISDTISGVERMATPSMAGGVTNNYYNTNLEMNPSYSQVQSEGSVYYDAVAALQAVRN